MIYGIVASEWEQTLASLPPGDAIPPLVYPQLARLDFVSGIYQWETSILTASQVVDRTDWIGVGLDNHGLQIPEGETGAALLYSDLTTLLAGCQFTVVIELETLADSTQIIFRVTNTAESYFIYCEYFVNYFDLQDQNNSGSRLAQGTNTYSNGTHKVAFTRVDAQLSISSDGSTVETGGPAGRTMPVGGSPMTNFYLGGWTGDAVNIHEVKIYAAQSDSELPGLSAL